MRARRFARAYATPRSTANGSSGGSSAGRLCGAGDPMVGRWSLSCGDPQKRMAPAGHNALVRGVAYEREEGLLENSSRAARGLLEDGSLAEALVRLSEAAAEATRSDLVVVRTLSPDRRCLVARAVRAESPALAAELEGS